MNSTTKTINGTDYELRPLTRGMVRNIELAAADQQTDLLVEETLVQQVDVDDLPMPDYVAIIEWATKTNGLDGAAIADAKKN